MGVKVRQKNGKWWVFIDHHGKRKAKCVGEKRTAQHVAEQLRAKLALGEFEIADEQDRRPFADVFRHWLDTYPRRTAKPLPSPVMRRPSGSICVLVLARRKSQTSPEKTSRPLPMRC